MQQSVTLQEMAKLYLLGTLLILVAIGYQYREEISTLVNGILKDSDSAPTARVKKEDTTRKQSPSQETVSETDEATMTSSTDADESYYNPPFDADNPPEPIISQSGTRLITLNELAAHGHSGTIKPIWLAILGKVYDVDKGAEHYYGPNGGYKFFTGERETLYLKREKN